MKLKLTNTWSNFLTWSQIKVGKNIRNHFEAVFDEFIASYVTDLLWLKGIHYSDRLILVFSHTCTSNVISAPFAIFQASSFNGAF